MATCPNCKNEISSLIRDVETEEHFLVSLNENGKYQEKEIYQRPITTAFICPKCLKQVDGEEEVMTIEDAITFLRGGESIS